MLAKHSGSCSHQTPQNMFICHSLNMYKKLLFPLFASNYVFFRLFIAALHFNENGNKEQRNIKKGEEAGKLMWRLSYQKSRQSAGVI